MLLSDLAKFFDQHQISGAPVVGEDGKFIGLVTENQLMVIDRSYTKFHMPTGISLLIEACNGNIQNLAADAKKTVLKTVQAIYMRLAATIEEDTPVEDIAALMTEKGATPLPVLLGGKLVGIVGRTDVIRTVCRKSYKVF